MTDRNDDCAYSWTQHARLVLYKAGSAVTAVPRTQQYARAMVTPQSQHDTKAKFEGDKNAYENKLTEF